MSKSEINLMRRAMLFGVPASAVIAALPSLPAFALAPTPSGDEWIAQTINNWKVRNAPANPNLSILAQGDKTVMNAVNAGVKMSAGRLRLLRFLGRASTAGLGIGLAVLTIGEYIRSSNDTVTAARFNEYTGNLPTYDDIFNAVSQYGPIVYGGYGYQIGWGGSSTSLPSIDSSTGWTMAQVFANRYDAGRQKYPFVARTVNPIAQTDLRSALTGLFPENTRPISDADAIAAIEQADYLMSLEEKKNLFLPALNQAINNPAVPMTEADLSTAPVRPKDLLDTQLGTDTQTDSSGSSSASASSSVATADPWLESGTFAPPTMPDVPASGGQWVTEMFEIARPKIPVMNTDGWTCPQYDLQMITGWGHANKGIKFDPCPIGNALSPYMRSFATSLGAWYGALIVLKA